MEDRPALVIFDVLGWNQSVGQCLLDLTSLPILRGTRRIILSSLGGAEEKTAALDAGADDFLLKPISSRELLARVNAVLRINSVFAGEEPITVGDLMLHRNPMEISIGSERKTLSGKEFSLLNHFMSNPGRVFSRDELLESVWVPWEIKERRVVDVYIWRIREKIEQDPARPQRLLTRRGEGYFLSIGPE
jgi:DNA-binding response OmpR family regulator